MIDSLITLIFSLFNFNNTVTKKRSAALLQVSALMLNKLFVDINRYNKRRGIILVSNDIR
jgi:hypothetical protein